MVEAHKPTDYIRLYQTFGKSAGFFLITHTMFEAACNLSLILKHGLAGDLAGGRRDEPTTDPEISVRPTWSIIIMQGRNKR